MVIRLIVFALILMFLVPTGAMRASVGDSAFSQATSSAVGGDNGINTVVIQPNATDGKDTFIASDDQYTHYNTYPVFYAGMNTGGEPRGLIQFPNDFPEGEIIDAKISLYCEDIYRDPQGIEMTAHTVMAPWDQYGVLWNNRNNDTLWGAPGGDYLTTIVSYTAVSHKNAWFTLNITDVVKGWRNGSIPNYGLILTGTPLNQSASASYVSLSSSEATDPLHRPKLTITYSAQIDPQVPPITTNEDTPVDIDLGGRAHGTVEHISASANTSTNMFPFAGGFGDEFRYQALYLSSEVGAEGKIMRISFEKDPTSSFMYGNFSNVRISMAHTDLTNLTHTFADNYDGFLVEVFKAKEVVLNSSDGSNTVSFALNGNFTYDSAHNLLIDIQWQGDGGTDVAFKTHLLGHAGSPVRRLWNYTDMTSSTGTLDSDSSLWAHVVPVIKFSVDAERNAAYDEVLIESGFYPFSPNTVSELRCQYLYNHTMLNNESGTVTELMFQSNIVGSATMDSFSIRMAHSQNDSLSAFFENNHVEPWTVVMNRTSYTVNSYGGQNWITIELDHPFYYNGQDNLLIDFIWKGGSGDDVWLNGGTGLSYNSRLHNTVNSSASSGTLINYYVNIHLVFQNYDSVFSWSATSSNTSLFTVSVSNNMLHITPVGDAYGTGTVELTLHNGNGSVTQTVPVTINPVNDAPVISAIPTITCTEEVPYELDMADYMSDVDDETASLTVSTDSSYATVNGTVITFLYPNGVTGESVNITVTDPHSLSATTEVQITVTPVNDAPVISAISPITCTEDVPNELNMADYMSDVDDDTATLTVSTNSSYATVNGSVITFLYPKGITANSVNITVTDPHSLSASEEVQLHIIVVIEHPEVLNLSSDANHITIVFDMDMNMSSVESAFSMAKNGSAVSGTFVWSDAKTGTFTPSVAVSGTYDITIGTGARAMSGAAMLSPYTGNYTAPANLDSDGDGMPDSWEEANGFNPMNSSDAATDADHDGLSNFLEYTTGTEPKNNDTDDDGIVDGFDAAPLTPNESTGTGTQPAASSAFDPMMILVIILLVIVVILAIMLVRKKPAAPSGVPPAAPESQGFVPPAQTSEVPAYENPTPEPEPPVSYEQPAESGNEAAPSGAPVEGTETPAEKSETQGEVLDLTKF